MRTIKLSHDSDLTLLWNVIGKAESQFDEYARTHLQQGNLQLARAFRNQAEQARRIYNELEEQL